MITRIVGILILLVALWGILGFVWLSRIHDCEHTLGHGFFYCAIVWGGGR